MSRSLLVVVALAAGLCGCKRAGQQDEAGLDEAAEPEVVEPEAVEPEAVEPKAVPFEGDAGGAAAPPALPDARDDRPPAIRCRLDGPPLTAGCRERPIGALAVSGGALFLVDGEGNLRRYRLDDGEEGCALALDTGFADYGLLAAPEVPERGQRIDGPVYMRSGGPDHRVAAAAAGGVFLFDYLGGVHAVARDGSIRGLCPDLLGVRSMTAAGRDVFVVRGREVSTLRPRRGCALTPALADHGFSTPIVSSIGDALYLVGSHQAEGAIMVMRVGARTESLFGVIEPRAPGRLCSAIAVAGCGADVCVLDKNCRQLVRFERDGELVSSTRLSRLLGVDPRDVVGLAEDRGRLYLAAMIARAGGECEGAVFRAE